MRARLGGHHLAAEISTMALKQMYAEQGIKIAPCHNNVVKFLPTSARGLFE